MIHSAEVALHSQMLRGCEKILWLPHGVNADELSALRPPETVSVIERRRALCGGRALCGFLAAPH